MIFINGKLYGIAVSDNTDRDTGEVTKVHTAEVLHKSRGKSEIVGLKLDPLVVSAWSKCIGRDFNCEVRFYAMKNREGGIQSGLTLADKKALPSLIAEQPVRAVA